MRGGACWISSSVRCCRIRSRASFISPLERALLADDMSLGKTVQAIAACALLRELRGIERVLVVSPASLKVEWEEQIADFSDLPPLRSSADQRRGAQ